jgi:hypothetical protein
MGRYEKGGDRLQPIWCHAAKKLKRIGDKDIVICDARVTGDFVYIVGVSFVV